MGDYYAWIKLLHIFVAIVALGTSAGLGIILQFFTNDPKHGSFVLRAIERMTLWVVLPGYLLMLATGSWMASLSGSFSARWVQLALGVWTAGLVVLCWSIAAIRRRALVASRVSGGAFGLSVIAMLYLMVFKP
jgi:uncharacterized membrane protein